MVAVVFVLALANLGLGFALAVALDRFPVWSTLQFIGQRASETLNVRPAAEQADEVDGLCGGAVDDAWLQVLREAEVDPRSALERLLWIAKLDTAARRERLVELDRAFFAKHLSQPVELELAHELDALHQQLESWITVVDVEIKPADAIAQTLQELLLDQAFLLRSCIDALKDADPAQIARQFSVAMAAVNTLRDRTDGLLCQLLTGEQRLRSIAERYRICGERSTLTSLGLAALFDEWWSEDPDHVRLVSLVMLDLDRFDAFTQRVGTARSDLALVHFGDMLHDLLRKERGFDRVAKFGGQRFVMFLGDTSASSAAKGAERVRQTIEATTLKVGDETSEVTASLAVIEIGKTEGPAAFLPRLEAALAACKKAGGNCGYVDEGSGPEPICLPQYPVSVRVIELDESTAEP